MAEKFTELTPLSERAVRSDGTISLKIIQPGWGSSGYYPREVLERDIPKVFPKGTQQFWNHQTPSEEAERPEGDLRDLAAVTISDPIWMENGPKGPGMYAESKVFAGYAGVIDEIGEHIGVSIRGMGRHTTGEAEGRNGRIIQEIAQGKSVDFVTVPGAGGGIVSIFESAPNAGKLPPPTPDHVTAFLAEAGRVLSKANETKLKSALEQLTAVLSQLSSGEELEMSEAGASRQLSMEDAMSEQELKEAQAALAERDAKLAEAEAALAKMREQLLLREARDFVTGKLAETDLPEITRTRLAGQLARNPMATDGKLDEAAMGKVVETAVTEARTEIATLLGKTGKVDGNGAAPETNGEQPTVEAARKRINESLARIGYGGTN